MSNETLEFNNWWKEFKRKHEKDNDNGRSLINELKWTLNGFNTEHRRLFIYKLISHNKMHLAAELIPQFGTIIQKILLRLIVFRNLALFLQKKETEFLIIAIIKTYKPIDYFLLKLFFIINSQFSSTLLKELYYNNKPMFMTQFNQAIRKMTDKSYNLTVLLRDIEIKDYLNKNGDPRILSKIQMLYPEF